MNISKTQIIQSIAERHGLSRDSVRAVIDGLCETIVHEAQNGHTVKLVGFGNFKVRERAGRTGRNPATGEPVEIAPSRTLVFKASSRASVA